MSGPRIATGLCCFGFMLCIFGGTYAAIRYMGLTSAEPGLAAMGLLSDKSSERVAGAIADERVATFVRRDIEARQTQYRTLHEMLMSIVEGSKRRAAIEFALWIGAAGTFLALAVLLARSGQPKGQQGTNRARDGSNPAT